MALGSLRSQRQSRGNYVFPKAGYSYGSMLPQVETADRPAPSLITKKRVRNWVRALRPLVWWASFVLVLLAIHKHQQWMEKTRLAFVLTLEGKPLPFEPLATLGGKAITTGERIPLGWHTFAVIHSKVEPFSTNLFIWYGLKDLGNIPLKRAYGLVALEVNPPARILTVTGPEFTATLTNSAGMTSSVPTDEYAIVAHHAHSEERETVVSTFRFPNFRRIAPRLGTLFLESNRPEASFEVLNSDGRLVETGTFPAAIVELPEGSYNVVSLHHRTRDERRAFVRGGTNILVRVDFEYGTAVLETDPPGARVISSEGMDYGETPITLSEVRPGPRLFTLRKEQFEPLEVLLVVSAQGTNSVHTNLVSRSYTASMAAARQFFGVGDYGRALQAATDALNSKPGDSAAGEIVTKASPHVSLSKAEGLGQQGNYAAAIGELEGVLNALPDNQRARALIGEYKIREREEAEKRHQARLSLVRGVFSTLLARDKETSLFPEHEIKTEKKASSVSGAILSSLRDQAPSFTIGSYESPEPDVTAIVTKQEWQGGARMCVVAIGQIAPDETEILYEVLEYKVQAANPFSIGALINRPVEKIYVPLHPSRVVQMTDKMKVQIEDGAKNTAERIMAAIGGTASTGP
jgi:hypothetical protein